MKLLTKKLGILGNGIEGKSLQNFLQRRNVRDLEVYDEKQDGCHDFSHTSSRDVLFRSPGISPLHPALRDFSGTVISGMDLFLQLCPTKKTIGVTGTKGKGTTSTLISRIFEEANDTVFLLGNMGNPFFDFLGKIRTRDIAVLELSSFQLWDSEQSPSIAVLLPITPDHLDVHEDFEEYVLAKKNIITHQKSGGKVIYCADCPIVCKMVEDCTAELIPFSRTQELKNGVFIRGDSIIHKTEEEEESLLSLEDIGLRGSHNHENVLAAIAAAKVLNVRTGPLAVAIKKFKGLPYRLQLTSLSRDGVRFWNDSYATIPVAAIAGMQALADAPLHVVIGGKDKGCSYEDLAKAIAHHPTLQTVFLIGENTPKIQEALAHYPNISADIKNVKNFDGVFSALPDTISAGDHVLLCPAAASFDQFNNVKDRAEQWNTRVNELLKSRGVAK